MKESRFLEIISDPEFKIYGLSIKDILEFRRFLDTWMLTVDELRDIGVRKYERQRAFIKNAMFDDAWREP